MSTVTISIHGARIFISLSAFTTAFCSFRGFFEDLLISALLWLEMMVLGCTCSCSSVSECFCQRFCGVYLIEASVA